MTCGAGYAETRRWHEEHRERGGTQGEKKWAAAGIDLWPKKASRAGPACEQTARQRRFEEKANPRQLGELAYRHPHATSMGNKDPDKAAWHSYPRSSPL